MKLQRKEENLIVPLRHLNLEPVQKQILNVIEKSIFPNFTILDLGCGLKNITKYIKCKDLIGVDIWEEYLTKFDICGDILEVCKKLPDNCINCIIAIDIIEHLKKENGELLLSELDRITINKIIILTPVKWTDNKEAMIEKKFWSYGNKYNLHLSHWKIEDFLKRGYIRVNSGYDDDFIFVIKKVRE